MYMELHYIIRKFIYTPKLQLKHSGIRFIECIKFFSYNGQKFFQKFLRIDICDEFLYG